MLEQIDTLPALSDHVARVAADRIVFRDAGEYLTGRDLNRVERNLSVDLAALGLSPGMTVGLALPPSVASYALVFALGRLGCMVTPLPAAWTTDETIRFLCSEHISTLITNSSWPHAKAALQADIRVVAYETLWTEAAQGGSPDDALPNFRVEPETPLILLLTSGSTGTPKRIRHSHRTLLVNAEYVVERLEFDTTDVFLQISPLNTMFGIGFVAVAAVAGASVVVSPTRDVATLVSTIRKYGVTVFSGNFPLYAEIVGEADDKLRDSLKSVRKCVLGGALISSQIGRRIERTFGSKLIVVYGMTEVAGAIATTVIDTETHRTGLVGKPLVGTDIAILSRHGQLVEPGTFGEVWVKSRSTHIGQMGQWFSTEDVGCLDKNGSLVVIGRTNQLWHSNGRPRTQALCEMELLSEAGIKLASIKHGDAHELRAWIVLYQDCTPDAVRRSVASNTFFSAENLKLEFVNRFPMTSSGKVDQLALERNPELHKETADAADGYV